MFKLTIIYKIENESFLGELLFILLLRVNFLQL